VTQFEFPLKPITSH